MERLAAQGSGWTLGAAAALAGLAALDFARSGAAGWESQDALLVALGALPVALFGLFALARDAA